MRHILADKTNILSRHHYCLLLVGVSLQQMTMLRMIVLAMIAMMCVVQPQQLFPFSSEITIVTCNYTVSQEKFPPLNSL